MVLNADAYVSWIKKAIGIRDVRHIFRKDVIIVDPDYKRLPADLEALTTECQVYSQRRKLNNAPNYFKVWMGMNARDEEMVEINERMEQLIEEMSNTRSVALLTLLNNYPIIPVHAHVRPFRNSWLNLLCGIIVPVGLFFYFRIMIFRFRLNKDLERIATMDKEIIKLIETQLKKNKIENGKS